MTELSCIVPFCNEYPHVMFTIRNIAEELRDRVDFEIIAIDNSKCKESKDQTKKNPIIEEYWSKDSEAVKACERGHEWLKVVEYSDKLSHWQAKNYGIGKSTGKILWFCDAHCIVGRDSVYNMYRHYVTNNIQGTLHLPLTYKILEWHRLVYKLVSNPLLGEYAYSFTPYRGDDKHPLEVPVMSTCGMMISRDIFNSFGGWPSELGIYGGGEQFINFVMATMGLQKWVMPGMLCHHGDKRGYHWNYDDFVKNKILATFMYGGVSIATLFVNHLINIGKGRPPVLQAMLQNVILKGREQRDLIKGMQKISIEEWVKNPVRP